MCVCVCVCVLNGNYISIKYFMHFSSYFHIVFIYRQLACILTRITYSDIILPSVKQQFSEQFCFDNSDNSMAMLCMQL